MPRLEEVLTISSEGSAVWADIPPHGGIHELQDAYQDIRADLDEAHKTTGSLAYWGAREPWETFKMRATDWVFTEPKRA